MLLKIRNDKRLEPAMAELVAPVEPSLQREFADRGQNRSERL